MCSLSMWAAPCWGFGEFESFLSLNRQMCAHSWLLMRVTAWLCVSVPLSCVNQQDQTTDALCECFFFLCCGRAGKCGQSVWLCDLGCPAPPHMAEWELIHATKAFCYIIIYGQSDEVWSHDGFPCGTSLISTFCVYLHYKQFNLDSVCLIEF